MSLRGISTSGLVACLACTSPIDKQVSVGPVTTIAVTSEILVGATDIVVSERGEILLLDYRQSRVVVLDSAGTVLRTFGREGSGPGELRYPDSIVLSGDTLFVANRPNARIEIYRTDGQYLGARPLPREAVGGITAYLPNGVYLASTGGGRDALAILLKDSLPAVTLGQAVPGGSLPWDFVKLRRQIALGSVPPELQNSVRPVLVDDGSSWLVVNARGTVQRYDPDGLLLWEQAVSRSLLDSAKAQFFAANGAEKNPSRLHLLSPFGKARAVGTSLWVLLNESQPSGMTIAIFGRANTPALRLQVQGLRGATTFFVDPARETVYFVESDPPRLSSLRVPKRLFDSESDS